MTVTTMTSDGSKSKAPGVWESALRFGDLDVAVTSVVALEELGYSSVWLPDVGGDLFGTLEALLTATQKIVVASGVLNIWMHDPVESARRYRVLEVRFPGRILIGVGASHAPVVDMLTETGRFDRPLAALEQFLDDAHAVDESGAQMLPTAKTLLGALGPRALSLAKAKAGGALTYLVTTEYTGKARERLGADKLLFAQQAVVLTEDGTLARKIARQNLEANFMLPNYVNSWRRCGFSETDVVAPGSDALIDSLVAWGNQDAIADRLDAHIRAGANNVCIQVMTDRPDMTVFPLQGYRQLAEQLGIGPYANETSPNR